MTNSWEHRIEGIGHRSLERRDGEINRYRTNETGGREILRAERHQGRAGKRGMSQYWQVK